MRTKARARRAKVKARAKVGGAMVPMLEVLVMDEDEAVEKDVVPKEEAKESNKKKDTKERG